MGLPAHQAKVAGVLALVDPTEGERYTPFLSAALAAMVGPVVLAEAACTTPGAVMSYPGDLPAYRYVEGD